MSDFTIDGDSVFVPLSGTAGRGLVTVVDKADAHLLGTRSWFLSRSGYARRNQPLKMAGPRVTLLHRLIIDAPAGMEVDHIDGDPLNNRRSNLRLCDRKRNSGNTRHHKDSLTSRYKGVFQYGTEGKFRARIFVDGTAYHLGCFASEEEAACAYDTAARLHFGEFANTNF